jgi:urease accessory protein
LDHLDSVDELYKANNIDKVFVENEALAKRLHHLITQKHVEVAVHLPEGEHLRVGDVLYQDAESKIVVDVLPEDVLIIKPKSIQQMGIIAHELGNRHLPAQFIGDQMVVQYDYLVETLLQKRKLDYERTSLKLKQPFLHVGHHHHDY